MADSAFFCPQSHEGVLAVRGSDAAKFLQGQLTCNLNYLSDTQASLGARCTQKGRMQSSFRILLQGDGVLLAMATELLEPQLADLKKYAVFSKSKLTDESAAWVRFGLSDADAALASLGLVLPTETDSVARTEALIAIRVSPGRAELWVPAEQAEAVRSQLSAQLKESALNEWLLGQVRAGIGQVMRKPANCSFHRCSICKPLAASASRKAATPARKSSRACSTWASSSAACTA